MASSRKSDRPYKSLTEPRAKKTSATDKAEERANSDQSNLKFLQEIIKLAYTAVANILVPAILVFFFLVIGYLSIATLGAHHLQHTIRDITLGDSAGKATIATLKNFSEEFELAKDAYALAKSEASTCKPDRRLADGLITYHQTAGRVNILESENACLRRVYGTPDPDVIYDVELAVPDDKQSSLASVQMDAVNVTCKITLQVIWAENRFHNEKRQLYKRSGFGSVLPIQGGPLDPAIVLGEFTPYYDFLLKSGKGQCLTSKLMALTENIQLDARMEEPLEAYQYFTSGRPSNLPILGDPRLRQINSNLIHSPRQILTVMLVVFIGALGAVINLIRLFLEGNNRVTWSYYIFMPLLGGVAAFAVFVVAKSGVTIIADPAGSDDGAYLSPYFVGFLGLISGLLALDAFDSIVSVGRKLFNTTADNIDRWFIGDASLADQVENVVRPLANLTGKPEDHVKSWLRGHLSVPLSTQQLIASQINKPMRMVFTDISPATVPKADETETDEGDVT
jgi:hypothetical protein